MHLPVYVAAWPLFHFSMKPGPPWAWLHSTSCFVVVALTISVSIKKDVEMTRMRTPFLYFY